MGGEMTGGITDAQLRAIEALSRELEEHTYLAGGVAVAMQARHRTSLDVDLFVPHDFDADRLADRLAGVVSGLRVTGRAKGTLHLEVGGVPVSILSYLYPCLAPPYETEACAIPIAATQDLACMKVSAIAGRGAAKDFWDLHQLLEMGLAGGSLATVMDWYRQKYPVDDIGHAIRSLAYFGDADAAPLPRGLTSGHWEEIKSAMRRRVLEL
jgi:hypothetical protein